MQAPTLFVTGNSVEDPMKRCRFAWLTVAIVLVSTAAFADPVVIFGDGRRTSVFINARPGEAAGPNDVLSSSLVHASSTSTATLNATLTSSIADPLHWFGVGAAELTATSAGRDTFASNALFYLEFEVTAPVNYSFAGTFFHSRVSTPATFAFARAGAELTGRAVGFQPVFDFDTGSGALGAADRSFTGTLAAGDYELFVLARSSAAFEGSATAAAGYRFTMDFTPADAAPVPEPASMLLVGMGAAGLAARRRSRRRSAS